MIPYAVLVAVALALRLVGLDDKPFHHDESQDAYFSWIFFTRGEYEYDPLLHGPLRFYLTAAMYGLFGDSDFTARLAPALMGGAMVGLPYFLRDQLGRVGAFSAAVLLAVGPTYLYFSRFAREDIYFACLSLAMLVVVFRLLKGSDPLTSRRRLPALLGALLALSFATKETTFITCFVAGTFFLGVLAWKRELLVEPIRSLGLDAWGWGLAAFAGVFTVLFTTFLTHSAGLWDGIYTGLEYWLGQHEVGRGGEPWFFYGVLLFAHEWPVLLLGGVGAVVALRRPTLLRAFLIWAFAVSLVVYSWAGEKFAWLALHPLLPLLLLAGIGVQAIWEARRRWYGALGLAVTAVAFAYVVSASWLVNARHSADPREFLVTTQSSEEVKRIADRLVAEAARADRDGRAYRITVDSAAGATYPWAWYFRDLPVDYPNLGETDATPRRPDALILTQAAHDRVQLPGYTQREFPFRVWWVRDYGAMSPGNWWRWFTRRDPWNPTGGMPEWLYLRR
ncbi:MAG: flippase activity-associated protein Agl23 [Solirubrobacteraceae bacterium]